ncbi:hypothetical protein CCACVL1_06068 [Corchorus capsularis]|uniref:Uncharacterized protein n=1 Tax=Corchorus capsularis TaxID=210143 RepID=A0A1R3JHN3_COCAP|nr:hypothetical protein CCACVL1_06068 [Corchorus capsularis]
MGEGLDFLSLNCTTKFDELLR